MNVRDIVKKCDRDKVIGRAVFEERCSEEEKKLWAKKYFAQYNQLINAKVIRDYDMMFYLQSVYESQGFFYGDVSAVDYKDLKNGKTILYSLSLESTRRYASLYVPEITLNLFTEEVVAAEILREMGWNSGYQRKHCPAEVEKTIIKYSNSITSGIFEMDDKYKYFDECCKEFIHYMRKSKKRKHI